MTHYKLQPNKSETCYRLIPTLLFIIAITSVVLTMFFMCVLQSRNAYQLDELGEHFNIDDFKMEITGATSDQIAKLDIDSIESDDITHILTPPQTPPFETFLLKKTINPTTNNHIKTDNNLRNMKAYKIVSKEPIIENSLVKIVMAPQNVLEKLSKQGHSNVKYGIDKIDKSGNGPMKNYSIDDSFDRESIQDGNGNVNVEVFSLEDIGNVGLTETAQLKKNVLHHESNNVQVIAKSHKEPLNIISIDQKNPFDLKGKKQIGNDANNIRGEAEVVDNLQSIDIDMETKTILPAEIDSRNVATAPITTETIMVAQAYPEAEEMLSNPTTSQNLVQREHMKSEFSQEDKVSTEMNSSIHRTSSEDKQSLPKASLEASTENNVPLVVLKILKNRTVLVEESHPKSTRDQMGMDSNIIPIVLPPAVRPKKISRPSTTTEVPVAGEAKQSQYKNAVSKLKAVSIEKTPKTSLLDVQTTHQPPESETTLKSKNMKRAVGDEGTISHIVRPSPKRPKNFADLLPRETDAERAERLSKSMQRLMHFVTICGHVDSYLTKRFRHGLKNVVKIFDSMEDTRRRRSNL